MVHVTVEGPMSTVTLPPLTIHTTVEGQLEATVTFGFKSGGDFASGTYAIAVNVTESGIPSNTLTTAMLVE
jgi:hypothetical protein